MIMIMLRSWNRCQGALYWKRDQLEQPLKCLQCGYHPDNSEVAYLLGIDRLQQSQEADYLAKPALVA